MSNTPVKKVVLPVAGLGTRFLPATKAMPKEMLTIVDKPLIQYAVEEAISAGIEEIIMITGRGKTSIENHFDRSWELEQLLRDRRKLDFLEEVQNTLPSNCRISYTRQGEPLGLGHAIWCARSLVGNEPFAVLLADDLFSGEEPILKQMMEQYQDVGGNLVSVMEVPNDLISRYGVITPGSADGRLIEITDLIEKPEPEKAPSNFAISGRYILQPEIFNYLAKFKKGTGGEIQLTDAMAQLIGQAPFHAWNYDGKRFDCGNRSGFLEANISMSLAREETRENTIKIIQKIIKEWDLQ